MSSNASSLLIGLVLVAFAAFLLYRTVTLLKEAVRTRGTVVQLLTRMGGGESGKLMYTPVVEFTDTRGRNIVFESSSSSSTTRHFVGSDIGVLYREGRPDKAQVDTMFDLWGGPVIAGIVGGTLVFVGLFGLTA